AYKEIELVVTESAPAAFDQLSPAHGATGVPFKPHFSWEGAPLAVTYLLEVDDDPDFGSVDYSATVAGTSHHMEANLSPSTTYYWRVTAQNICGSTPSVAIASFTVQEPWNAC